MDVVVAAGGARWEASALAEIESAPDLRLVRRCVDAADLLSLAGSGFAQVAFVDPLLPGLDVDGVARLERAGIAVVAVGPGGERLGISRVAQPGSLGAVVAEAMPTPQSVPAPTANGTVIAVWGPTGAPGRTTVAVSLAAAFGARGLRCVLVDADTQGGAVAQTLAVLDEVSGLMAACRSANSGHRAAVAEHLLSCGAFDLLTGIPRADMWMHIRPAPLELVLRTLAQWYDVVVVDCGFGTERGGPGPTRDQSTLAVLDTCDQVVVVGRADPVGVTRLVRALDATGPLHRPVIVMNQLRASAGWDERSLGQVLHDLTGRVPAVFLPADPVSVDKALLSGRTLREVAPNAPVVARIDRLATELLRQRVTV